MNTSDTAPRPPPSRLVVRWVTSEQARRHVEYNQIRPSWRHFVPELGRTRVGVCFDLLTTANWRANTKQIGVVVDTARLPSTLQRFEFDGHKVFCLSEALSWEIDRAKQLALMRDARRQRHVYTQFPDELFVTGTIDALGDRISGIVLMDTGRKLGPKCESEIREYCDHYDKPIIEMTPQEFNDASSAPASLKGLIPPCSARNAGYERMRA